MWGDRLLVWGPGLGFTGSSADLIGNVVVFVSWKTLNHPSRSPALNPQTLI